MSIYFRDKLTFPESPELESGNFLNELNVILVKLKETPIFYLLLYILATRL